MRLSAISPFTPIFTRELRSLARRKRTYLLRTGYLGLFTLILLGVWASMRAFQSENPNAISTIQMQNQTGQALFSAFSMFNIVLLGSIGPLLTCTAISSERLGNTLHVLLMTPLSSWQIVIGKLSSRLMAAAMLLIISTPVLAVIRLLGGVELWQVGQTISLSAMVVFCGASVGLFFSALTTRTLASILFSYGFFAILYIVVPILVSACVAAGWLSPPEILTYLQFHPFATALSIVNDFDGEISFWPGFILQFVLGSIALIATTFLVRRRVTLRREIASHTSRIAVAPVADAASDDAPITPVSPSQNPAPSPIPALEYASAATPIASRDVGDNPVLWRELRRDLFHRRPALRWIAIAALGFVFLLLYTSQWRVLLLQEELHYVVFCLVQGALLLLVGMTTASSIAYEKESETWQLIVSTPLSGRQLVYGKILGTMSRLAMPASLVLFHLIVFTIFGPLHWIASIVVLLTLTGFVLPWIPIGLFLSLRLNRTTSAVVFTLILQLLVYAGIPAALNLARALFGIDEDILAIAWAIEPFYYIVESIDRSPLDFTGRIRLFDLNYYNVSEATWLGVFLLVWLIHLFIAWLGIEAIIRSFDRIVSRAPQLQN